MVNLSVKFQYERIKDEEAAAILQFFSDSFRLLLLSFQQASLL